MKKLLKLDLQHFAEEAEGNEDKEGTATEDVTTTQNSSDGTQNTEEQGKDKIPYDRFKQKVDEVNALKQELDRLKQAEEAQRMEELKEQEKYKELYEEAVRKAEELTKFQQEQSKVQALTLAGYADEQIQMMVKLVEGTTEEEVKESIEQLKKTFPVQKAYVDPSADNGARQTPKSKDGEDMGKEMFKKLFDKGKLKGFKK